MSLPGMPQNLILPMILLTPLLAVPLAWLKARSLRDSITLLIGILLCVEVASLYPVAAGQEVLETTLLTFTPTLHISFRAEGLGVSFALITSFLWSICTLYNSSYLHTNAIKNQRLSYIFFASTWFCIMGIALAENLLTLFLFSELLTLCTVLLLMHSTAADTDRAGKIYVVYLAGASLLFFLPVMVWVYTVTGTLSFTSQGILPAGISPDAAGIALLLFVFGTAKAAIMPMHRWLRAAMVSPAPVNALLCAVAMVNAGAFTLLKIIVYIFGTDTLIRLNASHGWASGWLVYISGATMIAASLFALRQRNLKALLTYSTIAQLAAVPLGASLLSPSAIKAASFQLAAHAVAKITLFFAAGAIYTVSGKTDVKQLRGIGRRMPLTMACFTVAALSLIGMPPFAGFLSSYYLMQGAFSAQHYLALACILCSTLLSAAYLLPIIIDAFLSPEPAVYFKADQPTHGEAPRVMLLCMCTTSALCILLFFYPDPFLLLGIIR